MMKPFWGREYRDEWNRLEYGDLATFKRFRELASMAGSAAGAIIGLAILRIILSNSSRTKQIIDAAGRSFAEVIDAGISPPGDH